MPNKINKEEEINKVFDSTSWNSSLVHLSTSEADQFIDYMVDESVIMKNSRVVRMDKPQKKIAKIWIWTDIFYPAQSWVELDESKRVVASADSIELISKEIIGEILILDDELEDNIEGSAFKDHLMRMIAKKWMNQIERVSLYARKNWGTNTLYEIFDWYIKEITQSWNVVDASATTLFTDRNINKSKLGALYKSIPTKFRQYIDSMYLHNDLIIDYEELYEATMNAVDRKWAFWTPFTKVPLMRQDRPVAVASGGNTTIVTWWAAAAQKDVAVVAVTNFTVWDVVTLNIWGDKEFSSILTAIDATNKVLTLTDNLPYAYVAGVTVKETTLDWTDVIITAKNNFIWWIQRDITIEPERKARLRWTLFVITARMDVKVEEPTAAGILTNLLVK